MKRAHIKQMKELAEEFVNKSDKNSNTRYNYFNKFYHDRKLLFPWLEKESLRWHVRGLMSKQSPPELQQTQSNEIKCQVRTLIFIYH